MGRLKCAGLENRSTPDATGHGAVEKPDPDDGPEPTYLRLDPALDETARGELAEVVAIWPTLDARSRAGILALVGAEPK